MPLTDGGFWATISVPAANFKTREEGIMNWCFYRLIIYAWRNRLIDRDKFKSLWGIVQAMSEERECTA
jgi:hypothetical protein